MIKPRSLNPKNPIECPSTVKKESLFVKENENHVDLKKLSTEKLLEILERETKVTQNKNALNKLKDKGEKVLQFKKQVEDELQKRKETDANLNLAMAGLSLNADINGMEWTGKFTEKEPEQEDVLEDETNPFKILATHSGTNFHKKQIKKEEETDLSLEPEIDEFALKLCNKLDHVEPKERFLPFRTLKSKNLSPKHVSKDNTLSAAKEPALKFGPAKLVPLEESLALQAFQTNHLKELQLKNAAERLKNREFKMIDYVPSKEKVLDYRETEKDSDDENNLSDVD